MFGAVGILPPLWPVLGVMIGEEQEAAEECEKIVCLTAYIKVRRERLHFLLSTLALLGIYY